MECSPFMEFCIEEGDVFQPLRFPGQYYDEETGLHYNWHRYYKPEWGRYVEPSSFYPLGLKEMIDSLEKNLFGWMYVDPEIQAGQLYFVARNTFKDLIFKGAREYYQTITQENNPFIYVINNPLRDIDPQGNVPQAVVGGAIAGCVLGSGFEAAALACEKPCATPREVFIAMGKGCVKGAATGVAWAWGTRLVTGTASMPTFWGQRIKTLYKCFTK